MDTTQSFKFYHRISYTMSLFQKEEKERKQKERKKNSYVYMPIFNIVFLKIA